MLGVLTALFPLKSFKVSERRGEIMSTSLLAGKQTQAFLLQENFFVKYMSI